MARITVEDCLEKEPNRFSLVQLASKRTKQLLTGARPLVDVRKGNKAVVNSLREIAEGLVRFKTDEDLAREREAEELRRQREMELSAAQELSRSAAATKAADSLFSNESSEEAASEDGDASKDGTVNSQL